MIGVTVRTGKRKTDPARIARAGAEVARRHGVDGITMRSVAAEFGVTPMALYRWYDTADALRQAAVGAALGRILSPPPDGTPTDRLRGWALGARPQFARVQGLSEACLRWWPETHEGARIMEWLLGVTARHTDDVRRQYLIAHTIFIFVVTQAGADRAILDRRRSRPQFAHATKPRLFPRLSQVEVDVRTVDLDAQFSIGLEALLFALLGPARRRRTPHEA